MSLSRFACVTLCFALSTVMWAGDDDDDDRRRDNRKVWEAGLVPIATLGIQGATGVDPLDKGAVEVSTQGNVEVTLEGAMRNAAYTVSFCRFALTNVGCMSLANGTFNTNGEGNAKAEMLMPMQGANWSGIFILARGATPQFATAFTTRNANPPPGAEIEIKGRISTIDPATNSFRMDSFPMPVFLTSRTNLVKFDSLSQLRIGDRVEVRGVSINGAIEASRVKGED